MTDSKEKNINEIIDNIYMLPADSKRLLLSLISEIEYPKGFHLYRENKRSSKSYFISKGIARAYANKEGKEVTFWFGKEGDIVFPLETLYSNKGEYSSVELLEDCILYELDLNRLQDLFLKDIHIANWGRKYAEISCIRSEKLYISRQFRTSLERYQELIDDYPDITQRVPLSIIASFLGISQANLSRVRAKIK